MSEFKVDDKVITEGPRVVYINEYEDWGISCYAYDTEQAAVEAGARVNGKPARILKFIEVIE